MQQTAVVVMGAVVPESLTKDFDSTALFVQPNFLDGTYQDLPTIRTVILYGNIEQTALLQIHNWAAEHERRYQIRAVDGPLLLLSTLSICKAYVPGYSTESINAKRLKRQKQRP